MDDLLGRTALRPSGDRALLLLSVTGTHEEIAARSEAVERLVAKATSAPVRATVTGLPLLTRDGTRSSLAAVHRAELIALPLLLLALLLVFRSPLAAAIPAAFGAATIAASTGALALLAGAIRLDAFALAVSCMVGLALAVDYSLLFVSRMREELADGRHDDIASAVGRATAPTTRTVAAAAAAIVVAMAVAAAMSPGTALLAAALGVSVVAVLAAATAMLAVPAMLVLVGPWLGGGAVPAGAGHGISASVARAATRRPALAIGAALLLLVASIPVLGLKTGAPAAQSLPSDSSAARPVRLRLEVDGPGLDRAVRDRRRHAQGHRHDRRRGSPRSSARSASSRVTPPCAPCSARARSRAPRASLRSAGRRAVAAQRGPRATPASACAGSTRTSTPPPTASTRCAARCRAPTRRRPQIAAGSRTSRAASAS